jgi:hypothetical protein
VAKGGAALPFRQRRLAQGVGDMDARRKREMTRTAVIAAIFIIMGLVFLDMLIDNPTGNGSYAERSD